jgi:hypothetical protein
MRATCEAFSRVSCLRVRVRSRSAWIATGGTKLARMRPCASRSASQVASFTSVLRPGTFLTCIALASTSSNASARTAQTGFQYTPVASMAACVTPWPASQRARRSSSTVVVPNVSTKRSMPWPWTTRAQATTPSRCTSMPAQR